MPQKRNENPKTKDALAATLEERGKRYGAFADHSVIAQQLKNRMRIAPGWARLDLDMMESLDMIQHKVARILNGDPTHIDSWIDIAGYAKLVADRLAAKARRRVFPL